MQEEKETKVNYKVLLNIFDVIFRVFVFTIIMNYCIDDGTINMIWLIIAYIGGIIFCLSPFKNMIIEKGRIDHKEE